MREWGEAIGSSIQGIVTSLINAIPDIIGFLLILLVGWILSGVVARIVTALLQRVGADRMFAQHGVAAYGQNAAKFTPSRVAGEVVRWLIRLVFIVAAFNVLGLTQVTVLLNQVLLWIPNLIVAAIILLIAPVIARFVRGAIEVGAGQMGFTNAGLLGRVAEIAIIVFAVVIAINQVGIAANLVNTLFIGLVAALAIAFGLAFGLGGRSVAEEITRNWYEASRQTAERVRQRSEQQATQQRQGPMGGQQGPIGGQHPPFAGQQQPYPGQQGPMGGQQVPFGGQPTQVNRPVPPPPGPAGGPSGNPNPQR